MAVKNIEFTDDARVDFHKAKCFMEFNGLESKFWSDVNRQMDLIKEFPLAFQIRYRNIRIVPLENFNYSIHYVVKSNSILVYRFLNQSQDF
ncbi:MAG: type II toxin-antitoxin system RelE/ParE family toxin [Xanthomarina sp.]